MFSSLDDGLKYKHGIKGGGTYLIGDEDPTVELRSKVTNEFFTACHVLVHEDVLKLMDKALIEKLSNQFKPEARLQLF